jgi:hypothetical protein
MLISQSHPLVMTLQRLEPAYETPAGSWYDAAETNTTAAADAIATEAAAVAKKQAAAEP